MKSWWIRSQGAGTVLEMREVPIPVPGPGQVLLRVRAASLNRGDMMAAIARHRADVARLAGADGAGEIAALGEGVDGIRVGDRVMVRARGAMAEYVIVEADQVVPIPPCLSWEQAGATMVAFVTAYESTIQLGRLAAGETMLVCGVSSGVGVACMQIGRMLGVRTLGVSGSRQKLDRLVALGLDVALRARGSDFVEETLAATGGRGVDLAVDLVGGSAFPGCQRVLADFGRLAMVGYVDTVMTAEIDLEALHGKRLDIFGVSNTPLDKAQRGEATRGFVRDVLPAIADGRIVPVVDRVFAFDDLPAAKAYVETDALLGKVVVTLPG